MEGFQDQVNQLTEAINAVIGQINAMTNRLDLLEQNNQAPKVDGPRAYPPQAEPNREEPGLEQYQERPHRPRPNLRPPHDDQDDHLLRLIKVEAPSFDGSHQPSDYLD